MFYFANSVISNLENDLFHIIINCIADAYLQVSVFVAGVLLIFYGLESFFGINLGKKLKNGGVFQVPVASALGALPGCGGALLVITQFTTGNISFGSVVAVLTSTMGDAAFLLIASEPKTGFFIMILGFIVGLISGWVVDYTHPKGFLLPKSVMNTKNNRTIINLIISILSIILLQYHIDPYLPIYSIQTYPLSTMNLAKKSLFLFVHFCPTHERDIQFG